METIIKHIDENKKGFKICSPLKHGLTNPKNIFRICKSTIKSKLGINTVPSIAEPVESENIIRKKEYILDILKENNIILDIENIQNIDTQSFEILKDIINNCSSKTFILEYTLTTKEISEHYQNLYKELKELDVEIFNYMLDKMDFSIAIELAPHDITDHARLKINI